MNNLKKQESGERKVSREGRRKGKRGVEGEKDRQKYRIAEKLPNLYSC